ncbi:hypothetical protein [Fodinibius sp. Rm-B-1B1-1]|uniref:hypothetical protein n=1 Tax=Fodinibius alkaliphilus TaxID=3140241 RepID=UPI00315AFCAA
MQTNKTAPFFLLLVFTIATTSLTHAQTTYEDEPGFFTPVVESLYLRGGIFEETQLIGPAIGYRFNDTYDFTLHTEYISTDYNSNSSFSLINVGLTAGQTSRRNNDLILRNEVSVYHSFNLDLGNYQGINDPSLTSLLGSSSIYKSLKISDTITFLPNVGAHLGFGDYIPPYSSANLRQGFDGFVAGPQFGLDTNFSIGDSFSITAKPQYRLRYNLTHDHSVGTLTFNVIFNL